MRVEWLEVGGARSAPEKPSPIPVPRCPRLFRPRKEQPHAEQARVQVLRRKHTTATDSEVRAGGAVRQSRQVACPAAR